MNFFNDQTSSLIESLIDTTHAFTGSSDIASEDGLKKGGLRKKLQGIEESSGSRHELSSTSVNSVSVEFAVDDVESHSSHVFFTEDTLLGGPLEGRNNRFFDFVHVLDSFGDIDDHIGSLVVRTEAPYFGGLFLVPIKFFTKSFSSCLDVHSGRDIAIFDKVGEVCMERKTGSVNSVVLILRLGHARLAGFFSHSFFICDDGVISDNFALSIILFKIVEADLNVEFTTTSNNVFTALVILTEDQGVRFGQFLETFDQLGEICRVLRLDRDSHHRGDGVFHASDGMRFRVVNASDGSGLDEILIDT